MFRCATTRSNAVYRSFSRFCGSSNESYDVLIIGGGSAGISLVNNWTKHPTASVNSSGDKFSFAVIEPSSKHYYQPLWTLVGGGLVSNAEDSAHPTNQLIPKNVKLIKDKVSAIDPKNNEVSLGEGGKVCLCFCLSIVYSMNALFISLFFKCRFLIKR